MRGIGEAIPALIDWIVEMDRRGLMIVPVLMVVMACVFAVSLNSSSARSRRESPAIIISIAAAVSLLYAPSATSPRLARLVDTA